MRDRNDLGFLRLAAALAASLALLAGCGGPAADGAATSATGRASQQPVLVELGIYSGRADPSWTLTPAETTGLEALLAALPQDQGTPAQGGLGYHGFTFSAPSSFGVDGVPEPMVAFRGEIAATGLGQRRIRVDRDRTVERFLLQTGRTHLDPIEISLVEHDLAASLNQ